MNYRSAAKLIDQANSLLIIQAENPDGDSLATSLALEGILNGLSKTVHLYCPVDIPKYLRYLEGWDRVSRDFPQEFDLAIIVDASNEPLLAKVFTPERQASLSRRPVLVIDHHTTAVNLPLKTVNLVDKDAISSGQVVFDLCQTASWQIPADAAEFIAASILADSLGLTSSKTTAHSIRTLAACVDLGADLASLDAKRRQFNKKTVEIFRYKGRLFERVSLHLDGKLAACVIPWEEIAEYSDRYNPAMLIIDEMRLIEGVEVAAVFKTYPKGKITCKLRANEGGMFLNQLAEEFGGGGHPFAAGFKVYGWEYEDLFADFIKRAERYLTGSRNET